MEVIDYIDRFSKAEQRLIREVSEHWYNVIQKTDIPGPNVYQILAYESFINNSQGTHIEALRRVCKACEECSPYRLTPEFDELCKF